VLVDPTPGTAGTALKVRTVILDLSTGAVTTEFVQEKGVLEFALQKRNASNQLLWFAKDGSETTDGTQTGIPVLLAATATTPNAQQVYMDSAFNKVLTNTGHVSYVTDFLNGQNLWIDSGGFKTTTSTANTSLIEINSTTLADFQRVLSGLKPGDPIVLNVTRLQRDAKGDHLLPLIVQFTYQ